MYISGVPKICKMSEPKLRVHQGFEMVVLVTLQKPLLFWGGKKFLQEWRQKFLDAVANVPDKGDKPEWPGSRPLYNSLI